MLRSTQVIVVLLIMFLGFKLLRFYTLAYGFHDMYGFMQIATSWMDGRPFMYENYFGYHQRIHNYYTMLFWGPFIYAFGAYGLFIIQILLLIGAYSWANERIARAGAARWMRYSLFAIILLGPIAGWLNDHTNMGWHSELTYLPLAMLFALSLMQTNWIWSVAAGLGVTLVKEDGAVLAAIIHLSYFSLTYFQQYPDRTIGALLNQTRFWLIGLGWGIVFVGGMVWLNMLNNASEPRLQVALSVLTRNVSTRAFWQRTGVELGAVSLLLAAPFCYLGLISRGLAKPVVIRLFVVYGIGVLTLLALNLVQSLYYYEDSYPAAYHLVGMTWPPRFVLVWGYTAAFLTATLVMIAPNATPAKMTVIWVLTAGLVIIQLPILRLTRPDVPGVAEMIALIKGKGSPFKDRLYLNPDDLVRIQCVADRLPARSNVMVSDYIAPYFHKHYLVWETGHQFKPADIAIIPVDTKENSRKELERAVNLAMRKPYQVARLNGYFVYVAKGYEQVAQPCVR